MSWSWTEHSNSACSEGLLATLSASHTKWSCALECERTKHCQAFSLSHSLVSHCELYDACTLTSNGNYDSYKSTGTETTKRSGETTLAVEGSTLTTEGATEQSDVTTKPLTEGKTEGSGVTKPTGVETTEGSEGATLTPDEIMEGSRSTTLAAEETTEESGGTMSVVEGTTQVPEHDKTITGIDKTTTEALLKSTLETEQTALRTKETTETQGIPHDYENTVNPISPKVKKMPRIVTTSAFTEGNSVDKTRRWPKDVPLIKQITGNYNLAT